MTKRLPCRLLALFALALAVALPATAVGAAGDVSTDVESLAREYREVRPSVWQRATPEGDVEHLAIGPEGLAWALTRLHEHSNRELERYLSEPTAERWEVIVHLAEMMEQMRADITEAQPLGLEDALGVLVEQAQSCSSSGWELEADAYPLNPGAAAKSSASWWNNCGILGSVYCDAFARVGAIDDYESKGGSSESWVSVSCYAAVHGSGGCFSSAYAEVYIPALGVYATASATNYDCGTAPLSASLSCTHGSYPNFQCTGSASNGSPPYEVYWKIGSGSEYEDSNSPGTGPWSANLTCKYQSPGFQPYPVRFRVVDAAGAEKTLTRWCNGLVP